MAKIRKPGPLSAADRQWLKDYQAERELQADGRYGRQTHDAVKADLAGGRQPDDPGAPAVPAEVGFAGPVAIGIVMAAAIVVMFG